MLEFPIQLFAVARELAGTENVTITLPECATVADLRAQLFLQIPSLAPLGDVFRFAVDQQYATEETPLQQDQEIALIPPVSGG